MTLKAEREARIAAKAAEKAAKEAAELARIRSNPIYAAIAPQRTACVEQAVVYTREQLHKFAAQFPIGEDIHIRAPRANSLRMGRDEYRKTQAKHSLARQVLTIDQKRNARPQYELIVTGVNEEGIERLVEQAAEEAAFSFDTYVAKLTSKVGACDAATVTGALWQESLLVVRKGETVERWKTQQILNFSVYGKAFNQWPTRLLKNGARA